MNFYSGRRKTLRKRAQTNEVTTLLFGVYFSAEIHTRLPRQMLEMVVFYLGLKS